MATAARSRAAADDDRCRYALASKVGKQLGGGESRYKQCSGMAAIALYCSHHQTLASHSLPTPKQQMSLLLATKGSAIHGGGLSQPHLKQRRSDSWCWAPQSQQAARTHRVPTTWPQIRRGATCNHHGVAFSKMGCLACASATPAPRSAFGRRRPSFQSTSKYVGIATTSMQALTLCCSSSRRCCRSFLVKSSPTSFEGL